MKNETRPIKDYSTANRNACPHCKKVFSEADAIENRRGELIHEDCYEGRG